MGVMIDIIASAFGHINRKSQEKSGIEDRGYRNPAVNVERFPGADHDDGEHDSTDGAGCAEAPVVVVVFAFEIRRDIRCDEGSEIKYRIIIRL